MGVGWRGDVVGVGKQMHRAILRKGNSGEWDVGGHMPKLDYYISYHAVKRKCSQLAKVKFTFSNIFLHWYINSLIFNFFCVRECKGTCLFWTRPYKKHVYSNGNITITLSDNIIAIFGISFSPIVRPQSIWSSIVFVLFCIHLLLCCLWPLSYWFKGIQVHIIFT